jgi:hypothetical protein
MWTVMIHKIHKAQGNLAERAQDYKRSFQGFFVTPRGVEN